MPVSAAGAGSSTLKVSVSGPNGFALERTYALDVRPANQILTRRTVRALAPGETLTLSKDMFADFVPGTGRVGLSVAISASLDIATLLNELDRYPFGCSEQITSRAVAMLYINELAAQAKLALDGDIDQRIKDAIQRLLARQDSNGSFGLWTVGGNDPWLDAYVTDFLTRARERNFEVPQPAFTQALDRLRNYVASTPDPSKNGGRDLAYALYVLARNGVAPVGDLRYIADTKLDDLETPIAKAQLAAALAMLGDKTRADRVYLAALDAISPQPKLELDLGRVDYGSTLRDSAALVTLASEGRATQRTIDDAVARVDAARAITSRTSTQEDAWLVLAARALVKQVNAISLSVNGEARQGAFYRSLRADQLDAPLAVSNQRRRHGAGGGVGERLAADAGAGRRARLQDRAQLFHARRRAGQSGEHQAEPAFRGGAEDDRAEPAVRPRDRRRLSAGRIRDRQSAPGVVGRYRDAGVDHRCRRAGEQRIPRRPLHRGVRPRREFPAGVHGGLRGARGVAGPLRAAAGDGRGYVPARPLRAHRNGNDRDHGGQMKHWRLILASLAGAAFLVALAACAWVYSLGRPPLGQDLETSHVVLDRDGQLLRAYATTEGRWRLPATAKDVDPRFLKLLFAYEDKRFYEHDGVDVAGAWPRRVPTGHAGTYRLRRLHFNDAGRPTVGAARAPQL